MLLSPFMDTQAIGVVLVLRLGRLFRLFRLLRFIGLYRDRHALAECFVWVCDDYPQAIDQVVMQLFGLDRFRREFGQLEINRSVT